VLCAFKLSMVWGKNATYTKVTSQSLEGSDFINSNQCQGNYKTK